MKLRLPAMYAIKVRPVYFTEKRLFTLHRQSALKSEGHHEGLTIIQGSNLLIIC